MSYKIFYIYFIIFAYQKYTYIFILNNILISL